MEKVEIKSIFFDIILILITGGLWNVWMQYRQIRDFNKLVGYKKYSFFKWAILTLITFLIYHIYHEYKLSKDILLLHSRKVQKEDMANVTFLAVAAGVVSATGLWMAVDVVQQDLINDIIESDSIS